MEILLDETQQWADQFASSLTALGEAGDVPAVAQTLSNSLQGKEIFSKLLAAMASVLEKNLSVDAIKDFKRRLRQCYVNLIDPLTQALPQLSKSQANEFLIMHAMFQIGLWPPHTSFRVGCRSSGFGRIHRHDDGFSRAGSLAFSRHPAGAGVDIPAPGEATVVLFRISERKSTRS